MKSEIHVKNQHIRKEHTPSEFKMVGASAPCSMQSSNAPLYFLVTFVSLVGSRFAQKANADKIRVRRSEQRGISFVKYFPKRPKIILVMNEEKRMLSVFPLGEEVIGTIEKIAPFGIFVNLQKDEILQVGIIHLIPQLVDAGYTDLSVFKVGEKIKCIVIDHSDSEVYLDISLSSPCYS